VPAPKPAARPVGGPILEIRLSAKDIELVVREPGAHDLGRAADVDLRVSQPTVSRRHARIILSEDRAMAYVQDGGGANGTRLNGKEVAKLAPLAEGDTIGIGDVSLKVSLERG
jgi:predicted component of type VI protein secretion system